ncbi:hypothetical protein [Terricaulis sp.]|uniref:hypothetical protein n=1 Tax=Terricaulis sp. TaxID=2768686 RepID=UPI0037839F16
MSYRPPPGLSPKTIVIVAIIEAVLLMGGVALYFQTYEIWGIIAAAVIGMAMFAAVIVRAALNQKAGDGQS